jgi:hypothetical protein
MARALVAELVDAQGREAFSVAKSARFAGMTTSRRADYFAERRVLSRAKPGSGARSTTRIAGYNGPRALVAELVDAQG